MGRVMGYSRTPPPPPLRLLLGGLERVEAVIEDTPNGPPLFACAAPHARPISGLEGIRLIGWVRKGQCGSINWPCGDDHHPICRPDRSNHRIIEIDRDHRGPILFG